MDAVLAEFGEEIKLITLAGNYFVSDLAGDAGAMLPTQFADLIRLIHKGDLSSRGGKDVLAIMKNEGGKPGEIAAAKGLLQIHDTAVLEAAVTKVIDANPGVAKDYREGKGAALQFLVGQVMRETRGSGNPVLLRELLERALSK
jgi:aspartyl-tRNA(Asn)/glutamyl-tRNA(Gln) amidotransferase subunit B